MTEPTFHPVVWAPSAIKDAVEHATEAFKAADGAFARVSTFELSALIDATRALIEHNEQAGAEEHSFEEFKAALLPLYGAEGYADHTPGQLAEMAAEELMQLRVDRITLLWLHAEAMWHATHHRAQAETQGLSHALLLRGYRGFADQVDAMAKRIRELDFERLQQRDVLRSIWLHVSWRRITAKLTTAQRELWADAVEARDDPDSPVVTADRWWECAIKGCTRPPEDGYSVCEHHVDYPPAVQKGEPA